MSFNDDRDMYGNVRTGMGSSDEVSRAGGNQYDQQYQIEAKLADYRKQQSDQHMDELLSPPSWANRTSYSPGASNSAGSGVSLRTMLGYLLIAAAMGGIFQFFSKKIEDLPLGQYAGQESQMVFFDLYHVPSRSQRVSHEEFKAIFLEQFKQKYGALFSAAAPWDSLFAHCTPKSRGCLINPVKGFEALRPFAIRETTLMQDMCEVNARYYHRTPIDFLVKPSWRVIHQGAGQGPARPRCVLAAPQEYQAKVESTIRILSWSYIALGVLAAALSFVLIRRLVAGKR